MFYLKISNTIIFYFQLCFSFMHLMIFEGSILFLPKIILDKAHIYLTLPDSLIK